MVAPVTRKIIWQGPETTLYKKVGWFTVAKKKKKKRPASSLDSNLAFGLVSK